MTEKIMETCGLLQYNTGHGSFMTYLEGIKKRENSICAKLVHTATTNTVQNPRFDRKRIELTLGLGTEVTIDKQEQRRLA